MVFCHQSCLIRTSIHKERPFSLKYKIAGDYDFFYNLYFDKEIKFLKLNIKLPLLISSSAADYEKWMKWFPEANDSIMYNKDISLRTRLLQLLACKRQYWLLQLYHYIVIKFVYGVIYK